MNKKCKAEGCDRKYYMSGVCNAHYFRLRNGHKLNDSTTRDIRKHIIKNGFALIPLGVNAKDGYAIVDIENKHLDKYKWHMQSGYASTAINGRSYLMHRMIIDSKVIDHKNRIRTDNRIKNLRSATQAQNIYNRLSKNKYGYRGIYKNGDKWGAKISENYRTIYLGTYKTKIEAAKAYDAKAIELHGYFAVINSY